MKELNTNQDKFWAIVELFGHTQLAGEVSKCEIGDFVQINIPQVGVIPTWSKMVNPKAIYAITPTTKEVAILRAKSLKEMPVNKWDSEQLFKNKFKEMEEAGKIKKLETSFVEEMEDNSPNEDDLDF